jgi:putative restriction endonuclease
MPTTKPPALKNICRIDIPADARGKGETHGWQFKVMRERKQQTKFFSDSLHGSSDAALLAAQVHRREVIGEIGDFEGYWISDALTVNNTSGIVGVHRSESIRQDETIEEVWQTTTPSADGNRRYRAFRISVHGELGALHKAVEERLDAVSALIGAPRYLASSRAIASLIETYLNILIYLDSIDEAEANYLLAIINNRLIDATEKQRAVMGRVGQATFRSKLERLWGRKCCVTGATVLLNASHIKPWALSNDRERLDPFNGLLLSPLYDKAFDQGLISFNEAGRILLSSRLATSAKQLCINTTAIVRPLSPVSLQYLEFHRTSIFQS